MQILCLQVHDAMASQSFDADVPAELVLLQPCGRGRLDWPNTLLLGVQYAGELANACLQRHDALHLHFSTPPSFFSAHCQSR